MNKHLVQLIEISKLDKEIDMFEPRRKKAREKLDILEEKRKELINQKDKLNEDIKNETLKISKNELHIKELFHKLEEIAKKSGNVKTEKELKALQLEEEIAKEQINAANSEIERAGKIKDAKKIQINEVEKKIQELEEEIKKVEKETREEIEKIEADQRKISEAKDRLRSEMDQKIIAFYEKIKRWAGNTTVVTIYKQACGGCFMKLNDKVYGDVIRGEDIITCPHCGRILSLEKEEEKS